jgi:tight adherence protein B
MGVVSGLLLGAGVLLVWLSCWDVPVARRRGASRSRDVLVQAGLPEVTPLRLTVVGACVGLAVVAMAAVLTRALPIAGAFGLMAAYAPWAIVLGRARKRRRDLREVWPEVVDHLASGVRAGLALPEAVSQLATRGPVALRTEFADFARDYRASGRFSECLDDLKDRMADPVADRIVEALRLTREVGGTDLGRLLRTLSEFLRDDNRTRGELEARQSWTVAGARLAVAGPWVVLAFLATRPETAAAYSSVQGAAVLGVGGLSCLVAYRVMLRIGRLPDDVRVLR